MRQTVLALAILSLPIRAASAANPAYSIIDLGTLGADNSSQTSPGSVGWSINAGGQVVGQSLKAGNFIHAFRYDGSMHDLGSLDPLTDSSAAFGINMLGQITGQSFTSGPSAGTYGNHPFLYDGTMHDLGFGGSGKAINDRGHIVGSSGDFAFFYDGAVHLLGTGTGNESTASSINNSDQITGTIANRGEGGFITFVHAFLYDGTLHELGTFGGTSSHGSHINDAGQVVGWQTQMATPPVTPFCTMAQCTILRPAIPTRARRWASTISGR